MKYSFLLLVIPLILLFGCGEKDNWTDKDESSDTTTPSPQEVFSLTLAEDILSDDDEDLKLYLEEEIYTLVSKSDKVTIDRISSSQYLISYSKDSTYKGLLIQKYYNPLSDEIVFTRTETELKK